MGETPGYTIALVQMKMGADADENLRRALQKVEQAAALGAQVICLPELYRSQYFCQKEDATLLDLAEPLDGPSVTAFQALAARSGVSVIVPFFERRAPGVYHNSAAVIDADGSLAGLYRKMHIPDDPAYYEKFYFAPGDLGFRAFNTRFGRIGVLICWDQWYPEAARLTALAGASTIFYPTAIGWHPQEKAQYGAAQQDSWLAVQRGHAVANGCYIAAANRVGFERPVPEQAGIEFWGNSFITDPQGQWLARSSDADEDILTARVDLDHLETIRRNWPFLRDRRIDAYDDITLRWRDEA
jgi:N-carbamoylputrescine amidase